MLRAHQHKDKCINRCPPSVIQVYVSVMITPDAERTMLTNLGVSDSFTHSCVNLEEMKKAKYVYIEGYLVTSKIAQTY